MIALAALALVPFVVTPPGYHMSASEARAAKITYIRLAGPTHHLLDVGSCANPYPSWPGCQRVTAISTACVASDGHHGATQRRFRGLCDVAARLNWTTQPQCRVVLARVVAASTLSHAVPFSFITFVAAGWWNRPLRRALYITPRPPDYFHQCTAYRGPG